MLGWNSYATPHGVESIISMTRKSASFWGSPGESFEIFHCGVIGIQIRVSTLYDPIFTLEYKCDRRLEQMSIWLGFIANR